MVPKILEICDTGVVSLWVVNDIYPTRCAFGEKNMGLDAFKYYLLCGRGVEGNWLVKCTFLVAISRIQGEGNNGPLIFIDSIFW